MSGATFDDAAKKRLAKSILSGKDDETKETTTTGSPSSVNAQEEKLEGEWDGRLHVKHADNGMIVEHDRHIPRARRKDEKVSGGDSSPSSMPTEMKSHSRVFGLTDHKAMADHIMNIVKGPIRKNRY